MKPITHHIPLRSNMESVLQHAANGRSSRKEIFTRNEIIRRVRNERVKGDWLAERKEKLFPTPVHKRIANVRKLKGGFKVVGIADVLDLTNTELKSFLQKRGYTGIRRGGLAFNFDRK